MRLAAISPAAWRAKRRTRPRCGVGKGRRCVCAVSGFGLACAVDARSPARPGWSPTSAWARLCNPPCDPRVADQEDPEAETAPRFLVRGDEPGRENRDDHRRTLEQTDQTRVRAEVTSKSCVLR